MFHGRQRNRNWFCSEQCIFKYALCLFCLILPSSVLMFSGHWAQNCLIPSGDCSIFQVLYQDRWLFYKLMKDKMKNCLSITSNNQHIKACMSLFYIKRERFFLLLLQLLGNKIYQALKLLHFLHQWHLIILEALFFFSYIKEGAICCWISVFLFF